MFERTMVRFFLAAGLLTAMAGERAKALAIPPEGLAPGSQYQIAFVTAGGTPGTSGEESYYNNFVTQQAAPLTAILPVGTTWYAITDTFDGTTYTPACANAPTDLGLPIYNTLGQEILGAGSFLVAPGDVQSPLLDPIDGDQYGEDVGIEYTWTGIWRGDDDGPGITSLGANLYAGYGAAFHVDGGWLEDGSAGPDYVSFPIYGISSPITVVPEPSTLALLATGAIGLLGYGWRRRAARTAKPAALGQPTVPRILSFPSHSSSASAGRRAA